ncbi:hypothetical protein E4U55_005246 [Claviceps digitariae]|nr:hypothetical protein E4U55_005246 [Claviceps digitariae]
MAHFFTSEYSHDSPQRSWILDPAPPPSSSADRLHQWESFGPQFDTQELDTLKNSIAGMALSRVDGQENLYVGGIWALRRSDILAQKNITHVLSVVGFSPDSLKNFKDEPWSDYGRQFRHVLIDVDDVDDANLLVELPRAVRFIHRGLSMVSPRQPSTTGGADSAEGHTGGGGGVFVHCAAGKSRSVSVVIAYLLWRYPNRFDPNIVPAASAVYGNISSESGPQAVVAANTNTNADTNTDINTDAAMSQHRSRKETAKDAVEAALALVRRTRPMAEPNDGFMEQLALWWEMGCPADVDDDGDDGDVGNNHNLETHPLYQRWAFKREVQEHVAIGQAPSRLRFEDEDPSAVAARRADSNTDTNADADADTTEATLRCKKCRRTLATAPFINQHVASTSSKSLPPGQPCPHYFVEPLSWMRHELEKGQINGRLSCPNERCGAAVGRYDWKGIRCACGGWVTPGLSLQRARVDEEVRRKTKPGGSGHGRGAGGGAAAAVSHGAVNFGIRMPPGSGGDGGGKGGHL